MRWPSASTTSVTAGAIAGSSVGEGVERDVDADGVAVWREAVEVLLVLAFALPGVGDVGVVGHHHHQPAVLVLDAAEVHVRAVGAALRGAAVHLIPAVDRRHL